MFTWGSKFFIGLMAGAIGGALAYGLVTGGDLLGVVLLGLVGDVGDHVGYAILLMAAAVLALMAFSSSPSRHSNTNRLKVIR